MSKLFKIFVGNLTPTTTEQELRELLDPHLVIDDVIFVNQTRGKQAVHYAFVLTADTDAGQAAIVKLDGQELNGRPMAVSVATGKKQVKKSPAPSSSKRRPHPPKRRR